MEKVSAILMAGIVGICLGVQPTINAALGKAVTPKVAAFHSVLVSTSIMLILIIFSGTFSQYENIKNINPIYWIGGVIGAVIVFFGIKVIPVLGTEGALSIFVSIQLITGVVISHFGFFGAAKSPINIIKIIGVVLLLTGVKIILK